MRIEATPMIDRYLAALDAGDPIRVEDWCAPELRFSILWATDDGAREIAGDRRAYAELAWADREACERAQSSPEWAAMTEDAMGIMERFGVTMTAALGCLRGSGPGRAILIQRRYCTHCPKAAICECTRRLDGVCRGAGDRCKSPVSGAWVAPAAALRIPLPWKCSTS
jgi:hypothetical protein